MKNYVSEGIRVGIILSAAAKGGDFVTEGALGGVLQGDTDAGAHGVIIPRGIFELPKTTGEDWDVGEAIYWDGDTCTTTDTGNRLIGVAVEAIAGASALGTVLLDGVIRPPAGA